MAKKNGKGNVKVAQNNNNAIYFVDSARTKFFTHSSPIN